MSNYKKCNHKTRTLILDGNPGQSTLCQALAEAALEGANASGKNVRLLSLSQMSFDPNLAEGYQDEKPLEPDLKAAQEAINWCDELIIVHPLWWGSAPAKLKGFFDRVLQPGFAFKYVEDKDFPEKLLTGKTASVLITSDTPEWYYRWIYGNGWTKILRKQILEFCGFSKVRVKMVGPIRTSTPEARQTMISRARQWAA